ncbi:MAG: valine--tRNA ligase, partial [Anaerolineae bacterium]
GKPLIVSGWATADESYIDEQAETETSLLIELVRGIRNVREEYNVEPGRRITALIMPGSRRALFQTHDYLFARLCNVATIHLLSADDAAPEHAASVIVGDVTVYLPLADFMDVAAECERLSKERDKLLEQIARVQAQLGNEQFVTRARPEVVERERARHASLQASAEQIAERLTSLCDGRNG